MTSIRIRLTAIVAMTLLPLGALCKTATSTATDDAAVDPGDASDCTPLQSGGTKKFPDGGTDYLFKLDDELVEMPVPPTGWTPLDATAEELWRYGFPERPTAVDDLASWRSDWAKYKRPTGTPGMCRSKSTWATLTTDDNVHWGGYLAQPSPGNRFKAISGEFDQPSRLSSSCPNAQQLLWVGLGGHRARSDGTWGLIQMGTQSTPAGSPKLWWENIGIDSDGALIGVPLMEVSGMSVQRGDHVKLSLDYDTSGDRTVFLWTNETTSQSVTVVKTISESRFYDGRDGDWVIERPQISGDGSLARLQNFGSVEWTYARAQNQLDHWNYIAETEDQVKVRMRDGSGTVLATTGATSGPSGGTFTTTWQHC